MFEISPEILKKVRNYLALVEDRGIPVKEAYIFGSHALNEENENSDIDLAIMSDKFQGIRILDRELLLGLSRRVDVRISPLPVSTDYIKDSMFITEEVINKGFRVS